MVDVEPARLDVADDPARSEADLLYLSGARQTGGHNLAFAGYRRNGIGPGCAGAHQRFRRFTSQIVDDQRVAGL